MFCNKCGSHLEEGGKFCPECGAEVKDIFETTGANQSTIDQDLAHANTDVQGNTEHIDNNIQDVAVANTAGSYNNETNLNTVGSFNAQVNPNTMDVSNVPVNPNTTDSSNAPVNSNGMGGFNAQVNPNNMNNYNPQGSSNNMNNYNMQSMPNQVNSYGNMPGNSGFEAKPKKKFNKLALILSLVVLLVVVGAGAAVWVLKPFRSKDPVKRLMIASVENMKSRQLNLKTELSVNIDPENSQLKDQMTVLASQLDLSSSPEQVANFIANTLSKYKVQYNVAADFKKSPIKAGVGVNLLYNDNPLIDGGYKFKPWEVSVHSKALLSKPIYMDLGKLVKGKYNVDISKMDLVPYLDILLEEDDFVKSLPNSEYVKFISKNLGVGTDHAKLKYYGKESVNFDGKTIKADKITLTLSSKECMELLEGILEIMERDQKLKESLIKKSGKFLDRILETGDYEIFGLDKAQFSGMVSLAKSSLTEENCTMLFQQARIGFAQMNSSEIYLDDKAKERLNEPMVINYYLVGNKLKKTETIFKAEGLNINLSSENLDFKSADLDFPSIEDSYDMETIINGDVSEISADVYSKIFGLVSSGSSFSSMIEDIKNDANQYLGAEDIEKFKAGIGSMLGNMRYLTDSFNPLPGNF